MNLSLELIATTTFGLESVARRELQALGYESRADRPGWLRFRGDANAIARCNLWLRSADRLLLELASFPAADFDELFDQTKAVPWEELLPRNARIPVRGRSVKSALASVPACQRTVKKAIVERLGATYGLASLPEDGPTFPTEVALLRDEARLLLDTTGAGLHKRGYRPETGAAPLKETLAAGLVLLSAWNRDRPFLDPFCGTGTLAIEAALIGRNRAPGLARRFASEAWAFLGASPFRQAREEARALELPPLDEPIEASDRDEAALAIARRGAERADLSKEIRFERRDFASLKSSRLYGCLVTNPPYGDRSGELGEVRELYRSMPNVFRRLPSWSFFLLTSSRDFERILGQEASRRRKLYNGDVECTFYQFFGPKNETRAASKGQAFGGLDERDARQAEIFANRLRKRAHHLRKWPAKRGTDCYRLYERDIKEVPLIVDRYGEAVRILPPNDPLESRTRAQQEDWLDRMAQTAGETLSVAPDKVFLAGREARPLVIEVREQGMLFEAHLPGREDPGLVPSDRTLRGWIREAARDRRVLVLDSGAGSFSVAAALGGARSTTNVARDASQHEWARRNFRRNEIASGPHRFVVSEAGAFLEGDDGAYDLMVYLAPDGGAVQEHLSRLPRLLSPSALAWVRTPFHREKLAAARAVGWNVQDVTHRSLPEEVRNRKDHRVLELTLSSPRAR